MVRKLFGVMSVAFVLCVGAVLAEDIMGSITKVDEKAKTLTVVSKTGYKETTYTITTNADTKFFMAARGGGKGKGKGGGGGGGGGQPPEPVASTFDELATQVKTATDAGRGGVNATITTKDPVKDNKGTATKVETKGGGRRGGGGDQ